MAEAKSTTKKTASLAEALVAFQKNIPSPSKDSSADTGKYSYDYASLEKLTPMILSKLSDVGLAYTAAPNVRESDGVFGLDAKLIHESGESTGGFYPLGNPNNPAQAIGSAITYARRYALLALTGVAPTGEDDDGRSAHEAQAANPEPRATKAATPNSAAGLREQMGALIGSAGGVVDGNDANEIMSRVSGGKPAEAWTAAELKKGKAELEALIASRKEG